MYVSFDDGASWQTLQLNLPVAPIHDLTLKDHDLAAATHGRAFWVLDDITPLEQLSDEIAHADRHLFTPRDAVRFRGPSFVPARSLTGLGTNPPNGATVYFYVKQKPEEEATLDFLDARDSLVRRFSSRPKEPADSLKAEAGLNRFVWDLRYADAHRFKGLVFWAGNTRGPLAVPGSYKVRLTVGGWSETRGLNVVKDQRGKATQAELQKQVDLPARHRERMSAREGSRTARRCLGGSGSRAVHPRRHPGCGGARRGRALEGAARSSRRRLSQPQADARRRVQGRSRAPERDGAGRREGFRAGGDPRRAGGERGASHPGAHL